MMTDTPDGAEAAAPETARAETAPDPVASLAKEAADLKDRLLRTLAEMENLRRRTEREGQKFDPNLHQAMYEIPDESVPAGTVVQVMQPGYTIGERVLRPALVGVSKGGPKAQPAEAAANDNAGK
jgi:molecular chaperone GrpE